MKKVVIKVLVVLLVGVSLLGLPLLAGKIADALPNRSLDPDGAFWWISIHHIAQALLFIPLFFVVKLIFPKVDFKLRKGNVKLGLSYVWKFTLFFLVYTVIAYGITYFTDSFSAFRYPMRANNILGYLGFQLFLSGPSEELIFRSFGIGVIAFFIPKKIFNNKISLATIIVAVIFALSHVGISFSPFKLSYSLMQVFYAFGLGLIYGHCFEKTDSIIYPMMIHSISNVISVGVTILVTVLL